MHHMGGRGEEGRRGVLAPDPPVVAARNDEEPMGDPRTGQVGGEAGVLRTQSLAVCLPRVEPDVCAVPAQRGDDAWKLEQRAVVLEEPLVVVARST